jgi:hypothetical protein
LPVYESAQHSEFRIVSIQHPSSAARRVKLVVKHSGIQQEALPWLKTKGINILRSKTDHPLASPTAFKRFQYLKLHFEPPSVVVGFDPLNTADMGEEYDSRIIETVTDRRA